ncbi:MAG: hypothetical protein NVS4B3_02100 [Gemmatimonadaceae bacterium]
MSAHNRPTGKGETTTSPSLLAPMTPLGGAALPGLVEALIGRAQKAEHGGHPSEARECYEAALRNLRGGGFAPMAATLLRWIARTFVADGDQDAAYDCVKAALTVAELAEDRLGAAHALNYMGAARQARGALETAERFYQRAREMARAGGDQQLAAFVEQNLGTVANTRGDFESALRHYQASLEAYRAIGLSGHAGALLVNLGRLYTNLGRREAAFDAYDDAARALEEHGDVSWRISLEVNRAELFVVCRQFEDARTACDRAQTLAADAGDRSRAGEIAMQYGVIWRELGDHRSAESQFERAQETARQRHDLLLLAEIAREQGELFLREGRYRDTLLALNRAHRLFQQLRARHDLTDIGARIGRLEDRFVDMVRQWGASIESADAYTQGHCERVAVYACALARASGMDERVLHWFRMGALLHDVGKIEVPPGILRKTDRLTREEFEIIKSHPAAGERLLVGMDLPWDIRPMIRSHHERWDGRGYPDALWGEEIPLAARILCIADVYDALTTARPYRAPYSHEEALMQMRAESGRGFDPHLFATFEGLARRSAWPGRGPQVGPDVPRATEWTLGSLAADVATVTGSLAAGRPARVGGGPRPRVSSLARREA